MMRIATHLATCWMIVALLLLATGCKKNRPGPGDADADAPGDPAGDAGGDAIPDADEDPIPDADEDAEQDVDDDGEDVVDDGRLPNPPYPGAPPNMPHAPYGCTTNCLDCHRDGLGGAPATPHPERLMCKQCHLPQNDVPLFVPSTFTAYP